MRIYFASRFLSGLGDSNARPLRPERSALPTALNPEFLADIGAKAGMNCNCDCKVTNKSVSCQILGENYFLLQEDCVYIDFKLQLLKFRTFSPYREVLILSVKLVNNVKYS